MSARRRKPTRRDLLVVVGRLQDAIGHAMAMNHDRNPNRYTETMAALESAHELCIKVASQDPPVRNSGPWSTPVPTSSTKPHSPKAST